MEVENGVKLDEEITVYKKHKSFITEGRQFKISLMVHSAHCSHCCHSLGIKIVCVGDQCSREFSMFKCVGTLHVFL